MKYNGLFVSLTTIITFIITSTAVLSENINSMKYPLRTYSDSFKLGSPVIIYPARFNEKAQKLKEIMEQKGINNISLLTDKKAVKGVCEGLKDEWKNRQILIIGNLQQNEAVFQLYARFLTNTDLLTPGDDGVLIQFIPNRNSPGSHSLIVAGSNEKGTKKAVDVLIEKIKKTSHCDWRKYITFDLTGEVKTKGMKILQQARGRYSNPQNSLKNIYSLYVAYEISGDNTFVELAKKSLLATPEDIWQQEGHDNHYGMGLPVRGWDKWARAKVFAPELVQKIDQIFLNYLIKWEDAWWRRKEKTPVFNDNRHHVYGTWGYWQTAKMLLNGLTSEQRKSRVGNFLKEKCRECDAWFMACRKNFEQPVLSTGVFINYTIFLLSAFQTGDTEIFRNGGALKIATLAVGATDNTGGRIGISGYEDSYPGTVYPPYPVGPPICIANFFYKHKQLEWIKKNLNGFSPGTWWELSSKFHSYDIDLKQDFASDYLGFLPIFGTETKPYFVSFRNGYKKDDIYCFITGNATGNINTGDSGKGRQVYPNMIARMSWQGVPWLIQNLNHKTAFHRNTLLIDSGNAPTEVKDDMQILYRGEKDHVYFFSGKAENYMNSEWTRSYIVVDNSFMIIEDKVKAENDSEYSSIVTWRSPCDAILSKTPNEITLRSNRKTLKIKSASNLNIRTETKKLDKNEGALKPTIIRQYFNEKLHKNQSMRIFNLFFPNSENSPADYNIKHLYKETCLLKNNITKEISIVGFGNYKSEELDIEAKAFFLNPKRFAAVSDGTYKIKGNKTLDAILKKRWTETVRKKENKATGCQKLNEVWSFDGFHKIWSQLVNFKYSSETVDNIHFAFDGNIKRYKTALAAKGKPFKVLIEFEKPELLTAVEVLARSNNGKTRMEKAIPEKVEEIDIYNIDGNAQKEIDSETNVFWVLDESYKAETYTYTGAKSLLNTTGEKFIISTRIPRVFQIKLYGGKQKLPEISEVRSIKTRDGNRILVRTKNSEIACLNPKNGDVFWQKKFPEIIDWAMGDANENGFDELAFACRDKSIKRLDTATGDILWSCPTWSVPLGLPYSVDIYKGKKHKGFIFSSYYHMNVVDLNGKLHNTRQKTLPGMWLYNVMGGELNLNGDGYRDAISRALWGHINLYDGKTGKVDYFANLRGRLVSWRIINGKDNKPDLLILTKDGLGLYDAHIRNNLLHGGFVGAPDEDALLIEKRSKREIWTKRFESTAVGFVEYGKELIVAHATGFISRYSINGKFLGKCFIGKTIKNIAVLNSGGKQLLLINTGRQLVLLNSKYAKIKVWQTILKQVWVLPNDIIIAVMPDNSISRIELAAFNSKGASNTVEDSRYFDFAGKKCRLGFRPGSYKTNLIENNSIHSIIISPDSEKGMELARKISNTINRKTAGNPIPILKGREIVTERCGKLLPSYKEKNLIMLGNINDNEAIIPLYARFFCYADAAYPGESGYAIRTIRNPWGTQKNVILIAASDDNGLTAGVNKFLNSEKLIMEKGLCNADFLMDLKPVFKKDTKTLISKTIHLAKSYLKKAEKTSEIKLSMRYVYDLTAAYLLTGNKTIEKALQAIAVKFTKTLSPVFNVGDYNLEGYARMLQTITDNNILDKETVRRLDINSLLSLYAMRKQYWLRTGPGKVGTRHQISGTLAYIQLCRLLKDNLSADTSPEIKEFINKMYKGTYAHFKYITENTYSGSEDEGGTQTNITSIFQYAFSYGENAGFKNGLAMESVKKMLAMTDNLSCGTGAGIYEDAYIEGATKIQYSNGAPLYLASFYFKDGNLKWLQQNLPGMRWGSWFGRAPYGLHKYDTGKTIDATKPDLQKYAAIWMKSRPIYIANYIGNTEFPRNRIYDKASLRSGFSKNDAFIAFQGFTSGNSYNTAIDPMTLLRFVDKGDLWLAANCQLTDSYWRSGFEISGNIEKKKESLKPRLDVCANVNGISFFSATLPKYRGGEWNRWAVLVPPGNLVLTDSFKADEKGDYSFISTLRSPVPTKLKNGRFISLKSGHKMTVTDSNNSVLSIDNGVRKMDAQDFWLMRKFKKQTLDKSQIFTTASYINIDDIDNKKENKIKKISENVFLIHNGSQMYLIGKGPYKCEDLEFGETLFAVSNDRKIVCNDKKSISKEGNFTPVLKHLDTQYKNAIPSQKQKSFGFGNIEHIKLASIYVPKRIRGFSVSPSPVNGKDALDDNLVRRWDPGAVLATGTLTINFHGNVDVRSIEFCTNTIRPNGHIRSVPDKKIRIRWADSAKNLKDKPFLEYTAKHSPDMRELYKMGAWQVNRFVAEINRKNIAFLEIEGLPERISELSFLSMKYISAKIKKIKKVDLDGNGIDDLLCETEDRNIIAISSEGKEIFSFKLPFDIIDFVTGDLDSDGNAEIIVACSDLKLYKYDCNGTKITETESLFQHPYTLNIARDLNTGIAKIAITFYYHAQFFDEKLNPLTKPVRIMGMWFESAAAFDVNGDKIDDLVVSDIYARTYCVNGKDYSVSKLSWSTNGIARGIFPIGKISNQKRPVLFAGMNKLKAMNVSVKDKAQLIWEYVNNDLYTDIIIHKGNTPEIIVGKANGNVLKFSLEGKLLNVLPVEGIVHSLALLNHKRETFVGVGTSKGFSVFDNTWNKVAFYQGDATTVIQVMNRIFVVVDNKLRRCTLK